MNIFYDSDIGSVREENQDRAFTDMLDDKTCFAVVCDGMGGENAGSFASEKAIEIITDRIKSGYSSEIPDEKIKSLLFGAIRTANAVIFDISETDIAKRGMGTTCVCAMKRNGKAFFACVGDSRAYIINDDIIQVSKDHTVVRELYESGKITKEEMKNHPQKNYITKAVGVSGFLSPDYFEKKLSDKDIILLCSDGLSGVCSDEEILNTVKNTDTYDRIPKNLITLALNCKSRDNITAAIIA